MLIGYARVSTQDQSLELQIDAQARRKRILLFWSEEFREITGKKG